jgi:hypothetical protein
VPDFAAREDHPCCLVVLDQRGGESARNIVPHDLRKNGYGFGRERSSVGDFSLYIYSNSGMTARQSMAARPESSMEKTVCARASVRAC